MNNITTLILTIVTLIVLIGVIYFLLKKNKDNLVLKTLTNKKRIKNINKHLKIADASKNLHEVRMHARKAMILIKKYGLVEEYRKILHNK